MNNKIIVNSDYAKDWVGIWSLIGLAWLALGVAYIPVNKIYQQGVAIFFYVPMVILLWRDRSFFIELLSKNKVFFALFFLILGYAEINSLFRNDLSTLKHPIYVALFVLSGGWIAAANKLAAIREKVLYFILFGIALICTVSIVLFFLHSENIVTSRLAGVLKINHVILGSYYVAFYLFCCVVLAADRKEYRWLPVIVVIAAFILFAQSRGAYLSLVIALASYFLFFVKKTKSRLLIAGLICCGMVFLAITYKHGIMRSGLSYRPEIFQASIELALQNFWFGQGIDVSYRVYTDNYAEGFLHSHNLLTHIFIELGIIGAVLFLLLWCYAFYFCYKNKHLFIARFACVWFVYSFVAFQTDVASFIAQPRLEWIVCWVPLCLVVAVMGQLLSLEKAQH